MTEKVQWDHMENENTAVSVNLNGRWGGELDVVFPTFRYGNVFAASQMENEQKIV